MIVWVILAHLSTAQPAPMAVFPTQEACRDALGKVQDDFADCYAFAADVAKP